MSVNSDAAKSREKGWLETIKTFLHVLILASIVWVFFYQPFKIPSGSMLQTLLVGDYLFVSKLSYGYSRYSFTIPFTGIPIVSFPGRIFGARPARGDVVVFRLPSNTDKVYIKRVIGLPGDRIRVQNGVVYINGAAVPRERAGSYVGPGPNALPVPRYKETLPNGVSYYVLDAEPNGDYDNTRTFVVPENQYFMMGDNRDNSLDSREQSRRLGVGFVPFENLVGRAEIVFLSAAVDNPDAFRLTSPWTWPFDIRWNRFFNLVR
jgi:signal peptidase I